jgi:ATP-binding cassette subfamily F protein 3
VTNACIAFGTQIVLDGATVSIEAGEKVGLVGRNGGGKTTLMSIMQGKLAPDSGEVQLQKSARVGYLAQDPDLDPDETLRGAAEAAFTELHRLHQDLDRVYAKMASAEGDALERLMKRQARLETEMEAAGGYAIDHRIEATLHGLGFADNQFDLKVSALSGGQKGRLALARILLEAPDVLLLDEPTNHLDIAGRRWLETFLSESYAGAVLLVSHDRWLLDRVVDRIIEVDRGSVVDYPGNYEKYRELRRERQLTRARVFDKQQDHVRREKQFIAKYKTGQRAKQARGRESRLERFKSGIEDRPMELDVMRLSLPPAPRSGEQVTLVERLGKSYGENRLFEDVNLRIGRGDRIGIIGPNGAGKTTLVRCLLGDLEPDVGEVRFGSRLSVGYYRQLHEHLDMSLCVWEYLQTVIVSLDGQVKASEQQARDLAGAFLFSGAEQDKLLGELSGGERSRAVLAGLVAGAHNLLVLDEPSNHLDIPSAERLEAALSRDGGYQGTLLLISHDRALLQATCDQLIVFGGDGTVRFFEGTYRDWETRVDSEARAEVEARAHRQAAAKSPARKAAKPSTRTKQKKPKRSPHAHLSFEALEARIEEIESATASLDARLLEPEVYRDGDLCRQLQAERETLQAELGPIEAEWARRAAE